MSFQLGIDMTKNALDFAYGILTQRDLYGQQYQHPEIPFEGKLNHSLDLSICEMATVNCKVF